MLILNFKANETFIIRKSLSDSRFIFLLISTLTLPGFILHYRYERLNRNRTIIFKQNYLEIKTKKGIENILYSDITEIEEHTVSWQVRNLWNNYSYIKLILKNKEKIYYNCLTETINSENNLMKSDRIKKYKIQDIIPLY